MEHIRQCHNVQDDDASSENMDDDDPLLSKRVRDDSDDESNNDEIADNARFSEGPYKHAVTIHGRNPDCSGNATGAGRRRRKDGQFNTTLTRCKRCGRNRVY